MTQAVTTRNDVAASIEQVLMSGNLAQLTPTQRVEYHDAVCRSLGINPLTRPFDYLTLNGKMVLYARKDATDQLRNLKGISVRIVSRERTDDLYIVTAEATDRTGRTDESIGAVNVKGLAGENLANALMKAETKAKRRVTLSIAGLGLLDETEIDGAGDWQEPTPAREPVRQPQRKSQSQLAAEADAIRGVDRETGEVVPDRFWSNDELKGLLEMHGLTMQDLAPELGVERVDKSNYAERLDLWFFNHPNGSLPEMIAAVAASRQATLPV